MLDIDLKLTKNPTTNNINDIDSWEKLNQQLQNALLLQNNDKKHKDNVESGIYDQIGASLSPTTINYIKEKTKEIIGLYVLDVELIDVIVTYNMIEQYYRILIKYSLQNTIEIIDYETKIKAI